MIEVRFHGRGGQGAVTAAELLAVGAAESGNYVQSFPFFGVERRGAPVQAFCRISDKEIRIHQNVYTPDYIVVLDSTLLQAVDVSAGLKKGGVAVVNTNKQVKIKGAEATYCVDATGIARKHLGKPIVNTAMLGAFAAVTGLVKIDALEKAIRHRFEGELGEKNVAAIRECYEVLKK